MSSVHVDPETPLTALDDIFVSAVDRKVNVALRRWLGMPTGLPDVASYCKKTKLVWPFKSIFQSQKSQTLDDAARVSRPKWLRLPASTANGKEVKRKHC